MNYKKSIFTVAEKANCSISTVSNVLNGKGRVSTKTRAAVLKIIQEIGYQPNSVGRSLRLQRTETLGLLFYPTCAQIFRNPFYAEVMEGLEETVIKAGYDLLLAGYEDSLQNSNSELPGFLRRGKVDGMILMGSFPSEIVHRFWKLKVPMVLLDSKVEWPVDSVISDGFSAEVDAVKHLAELGHQRILFLGYNTEVQNIELRVQGFLEGMRSLGLPGGEKNVIRNSRHAEEIYAAVVKRLKGPNPPTALIAVNDTLAMEILSRLTADGIRVPEQVSLIGYDDHAASSQTLPPLTTVRVDKQKLGRVGAEMLLKRINTPDCAVNKCVVGTELVIRDSVADLRLKAARNKG